MTHLKWDFLLVVVAFILGIFVGLQREPDPTGKQRAVWVEIGRQQECGPGVSITTQHGR